MSDSTNSHSQERRAESPRAANEPVKEIDFEKVLANLSARFVNVPSAQVDREIEDAQRGVCECLGMDLSSLWLWSAENPRSLTLTHLYRPLGGAPVPERMDADEYFPWTQQQILAGKVVAISSMEQLPPEAARDKEVYRHYGVKTTVTVPLSTGGALPFGALSFNDTRDERVWPEALVERLQLIAQIFANALARKLSDQILRESEERLDLAADSAGVGLWGLDLNTMRYWITRKTRELFGISPDEEVTFDRFMSLVHPDDRELVRGTVQSVVQSKSEGRAQYRVIRPDGSLRWVSSRGRVRCNASGDPESLMGVSLDITEQKQAEEGLRKNEERLHMALEAADMVTWELDIPTRSICYSENIPAIVRGANVEPYCSLDTVISEIHPEDRERLDRALEEAVKKGTPFECEYRAHMLDGTYRWILGRGKRVIVEGGKPVRVLGISMDITERKRTEEALRESEEISRTTFEHAAVGIAHMRADGLFLRVNDKFCTLVGHDRDELLKMTFQDITHPDDLEADLKYMRQVLSDEIKSYSMDKRYIRKDGSEVWMTRTVSLVRDGAGAPKHYISVLEDITERKRASEALRESEERFRALAEKALIGIYVLLDGRYAYINPAMARIFGYSVAEMTGMTPREILQPSDHAMVSENIRRRIAGEIQSFPDEVRGRHRDGSTIDVEVRCSRVEINGKPALVGTLTDIAWRKRADEVLRQSEERFRQVAETVSDFVWEVDADGLYTYTSPSVERILGYTPDELVRKVHFYDLFVPDEREQLKTAALDVFEAQQSFQSFPNSNVSKSGVIVYLETSGVPILDEAGHLLGYRGADTDVTDRRRAEMETQLLRQELAHFSRVATISELTASIAHELNQPLSAILSNAQAGLHLLQHGALDLKELQEIFDDIVADDERAADVIRSMRSMLKRERGKHHQLSLNGLITDLVPIVRNEAFIKHISIVLDLGSPLPPVEGNRTQLQQVILNLIVNAFEAMEASVESREVILRTRQADGELVLDVVDSGSGIPAAKLSSIFDPFFTTKKTGLGMGLTLSHSLVTAHKGRLWAENNPKRGATFHIALPISLKPTVGTE